jgi:hypothetical protein
MIHNIQIVQPAERWPAKSPFGGDVKDATNKVKVLPEYLTAWPADASSMAEQLSVNPQNW